MNSYKRWLNDNIVQIVGIASILISLWVASITPFFLWAIATLVFIITETVEQPKKSKQVKITEFFP